MSAFNGSGQFLISGTGLPYVPNTTISSTVANTLNSNLATGLSTTICRDGQSTVTANIPFAGFKLTGIGNGTAATDAAAFGQITSGLATLTGFLGGLTLSTAGSSATFGIAAGIAADSTSALLLSLASAFTKTTSSWAVGTATGSLDTGSIANSTWYHVFIIGAPMVTPDILISLSPTAPTLPATYTLFRRIGSMKTDGSGNWKKFSQRGNEFLWDVPIEDYDFVTSGTTSARTETISVPTGVQVNALIRYILVYGSNQTYCLVSSLDVADTTPSNSLFSCIVFSIEQYAFQPLSVRTNTSAQIRNRINQSDGQFCIMTIGWIDSRGQS